ncbi:hypothetical protein WOLCODRAFT_159287 [Wolfiporia cocos MD-104 SS10]|uniref:Uncharacterized protein n=1 Tax=Wolfiporia cocos (strain MD-104) TaxID=742152 RepID=A0A2H3JU91_WOLCO|nr:hypothetical protein WOLCODRAFT_159287 [Wolfiporia cocos MD-104 SS10]
MWTTFSETIEKVYGKKTDKEITEKEIEGEIKRILPEKVHEMLATLESVPNFTMPTDWEVYLDMAIDLYKRQYPDKLKGKIFEEEKKKESSGSGKTTEKATSKPAKADDKGKGKADSGCHKKA